MELFDLKNNQVVFSPQALTLKAFKALWDRDKSKDKKVAVGELAYVYYYCDYRSDMSHIVDDESRHEQAASLVDLPKNWKADAKIQDAIELYEQLQESIAIQSLKAARIAVDKANKFLMTVDLSATDKAGRPIHKVKEIDDSVAKIHTRLEQLSKVEEEVKKQIERKADNQGSMEAAPFEDGIPD